MEVGYLTSGERLLRLHRFRYSRPIGCAHTSHEIVVEEVIGSISDESQRCLARLDHQELVPRPEFFGYGAGVEQALQACIEKVRPCRFAELFFPKA